MIDTSRSWVVTGVTLLAAVWAGVPGFAAAGAWEDSYYQYRIPVRVTFRSPGWNALGLTPPQITAAVNRIEDLHYDPQWFAFNNVKVVEVDEHGRSLGTVGDAGFYLVPDGPELIENGRFDAGGAGPVPGWIVSGKGEIFGVAPGAPDGSLCLTIQSGAKGSATLASPDVGIQQGAYYLLRYRSRLDTTSGSAAIALRNAREPDERGSWRDFPAYVPFLYNRTAWWGRTFPTSYNPTLWPRAWTLREQLLMPFFAHGNVAISTHFLGTAQVDDVSLRKVRIVFLAKAPGAGVRRWMIYYQPTNTYNLTIPERRHDGVPREAAESVDWDTAERYAGTTRYRVASTPAADFWFAETTVKITPATRVPSESAPAISISSAANERQSFQLVVRPRGGFGFGGIGASDLTHGSRTIPAASFRFRQVDYVFLANPSPVTPTPHVGWVGDPLVEVGPRSLRDDNLVLWITIHVPRGTPAGIYKGFLRVAGPPATRIPLELRVYGFELPEYSPFRTSMGGTHITKVYPAGRRSVADFHNVHSREDVKKLARKYYEAMAEQKFFPHNLAQFSEIGLQWTPPPKGYDVDQPDNFFRLHGWDFTEFNRDLKRYVDELKVNSFAITHTNPSWTHTFDHLPGDYLPAYKRQAPFQCLAWHTFRETLRVGYDRRAEDTYTAITRSQYDRLILDFYRSMAGNLDRNGWLDRAYILVDETYNRGFPPYLHFLKLMKSDPLTARIGIVWCIQGSEAYTHRESPGDPKGAFDGRVDVYVPEINESATKWEKYYFDDYGVAADRRKLWNYVTQTSRVAIDAPGVSNRATPLEIFSKGGGGYLIWETFMWDSYETDGCDPWKNPWTRWGNGAMAYFYPPRRAIRGGQPDWSITPSLRLELFREGVDDYEYAFLLEELVEHARERGIDASRAQALLAEIDRFFPTSVHWSQNDAWYLDLRERLAEAIVALKGALAGSRATASSAR